jgi:uncharacterized protein YbjT (DUF2867 family)
MSQNYKKACVFGGTGFVGRQIVRLLAREGYLIKVATRHPAGAFELKTAGDVGQIVPVACDGRNQASIENAVRGCDVVINCVGILSPKGKNTFERIHVELPGNIAKACTDAKVQRFIHISALGCEVSKSKYAKSKKRGEDAVRQNFANATILRPGVIFGADDQFFNKFARLSLVMPFLPLIGGGKTKMQPVYVCDVAEAAIAATLCPDAPGRTYELGGPEVLSFKDIYKRLARETGRHPFLISLPWGLAKIQGAILSLLPGPLLTADQVEFLKTDTIVSAQAKGLGDLRIAATGMDAVLPSYLARYRPGGRFGDKKRA